MVLIREVLDRTSIVVLHSFHKVIICNGTPFINKPLNLNQRVNV